MSEKPTKKDFANLINTVMGQDVMTEKKLDRILQEAKEANATRGTEGLFDYLRELTNAPVNNKQIRDIANTVKSSGSSDQALEALKGHKLINEKQASTIDRTMKKRRRPSGRGR